MSRYDYRDPGTIERYGDGLSDPPPEICPDCGADLAIDPHEEDCCPSPYSTEETDATNL